MSSPAAYVVLGIHGISLCPFLLLGCGDFKPYPGRAGCLQVNSLLRARWSR
jgi:hypothetical protein